MAAAAGGAEGQGVVLRVIYGCATCHDPLPMRSMGFCSLACRNGAPEDDAALVDHSRDTVQQRARRAVSMARARASHALRPYGHVRGVGICVVLDVHAALRVGMRPNA